MSEANVTEGSFCRQSEDQYGQGSSTSKGPGYGVFVIYMKSAANVHLGAGGGAGGASTGSEPSSARHRTTRARHGWAARAVGTPVEDALKKARAETMFKVARDILK
eukprot:38400-Prorocentrum_minimum.AAC.4